MSPKRKALRYRLVVSLPLPLIQKIRERAEKLMENRKLNRYPLSMVAEEILKLGFEYLRIKEKEVKKNEENV